MSSSVRVFAGRMLFLLIGLFALVIISPLPTVQAMAAGQASHLAQRSAAHTTASRLSQGTILYQADWSNGMNGWVGSSDWKVHNGLLLNDGTHSTSYTFPPGPTIIAPYNVPIANYAVEAKINIVREEGYNRGFGLTARGNAQAGDKWQGYMAGTDMYWDKIFVSTDSERLADVPFTPDNAWHTYRIEVKDNDIKVLFDGSIVLDVIDNRYLDGQQVGLWCYEMQLQISSFVVSTL